MTADEEQEIPTDRRSKPPSVPPRRGDEPERTAWTAERGISERKLGARGLGGSRLGGGKLGTGLGTEHFVGGPHPERADDPQSAQDADEAATEVRTSWTLARGPASKSFLGGQLPPADPPTLTDPTVIRSKDADTDDLVLGEFILAKPGDGRIDDDLNVPTRRSIPTQGSDGYGAAGGYDELPGSLAPVSRAPTPSSVLETVVRPKVEPRGARRVAVEPEVRTVRVPAQPPRVRSSRRMSRKARAAQAARLARNRTAAKSGLAGLAVVAAIAAGIVVIGLWSLVS